MTDIKTYPIRFIEPAQLKDGTLIQLRPIHPLDGKKAENFSVTLNFKVIH